MIVNNNNNFHILDFDVNVLGEILQNIDDPIDRAHFAMSCRRIFRIFNQNVNNGLIRDHRPHLQILKNHNEKVILLQKLQSKSHPWIRATIATAICCFAGGIIVTSSTGCCCCTIANPLSDILGFTGLGMCCGAGAGLGEQYVFYHCCYKDDEHHASSLAQEIRADQETIRAAWEALYPTHIEMDDIGLSYQNAPLIELASLKRKIN